MVFYTTLVQLVNGLFVEDHFVPIRGQRLSTPARNISTLHDRRQLG